MFSQEAFEVVQVLAGMVEIDDLGGLGEFRGGDVPDPGRAVTEDRELPYVIGAAADAFCLDQVREHGRGLEGGGLRFASTRDWIAVMERAARFLVGVTLLAMIGFVPVGLAIAGAMGDRQQSWLLPAIGIDLALIMVFGYAIRLTIWTLDRLSSRLEHGQLLARRPTGENDLASLWPAPLDAVPLHPDLKAELRSKLADDPRPSGSPETGAALLRNIAGRAVPAYQRLLAEAAAIAAQVLVLAVLIGTLTIAFTASRPESGYVTVAILALAPVAAWFIYLYIDNAVRAFRARMKLGRTGRYVLYLRSSDVDRDPADRGFERALVLALEDVAPVILVEGRWRRRHSPAIRVRLPPDAWLPPVLDLVDNALLTVFVMTPRRGYDHTAEPDPAWLEMELARASIFRGRALIRIWNCWDDRPVTVVNSNGTICFGGEPLAAEIGRVLNDAIGDRFPGQFDGTRWIWFSPNGEPVAIGRNGHDAPRRSTARNVSHDLRIIKELFGVPRRLPPARGIKLTAAFIAAAALVWLGGRAIRPGLNGVESFFRQNSWGLAVVALALLLLQIAVAWPWLHQVWNRRRYGVYQNHVLAKWYYNPDIERPLRRGADQAAG